MPTPEKQARRDAGYPAPGLGNELGSQRPQSFEKGSNLADRLEGMRSWSMRRALQQQDVVVQRLEKVALCFSNRVTRITVPKAPPPLGDGDQGDQALGREENQFWMVLKVGTVGGNIGKHYTG